MRLIISEFPQFWLISILWIIENHWILCRLLKSLLLYYDINRFCTFHITLSDYFILYYSYKKPVISLIHKKWVTNYFWIYSALWFVVSFVLGVMLYYGNQIITGQEVTDRTDPWSSDLTGISDSAFVIVIVEIFLLC